MIKYRGFMLQGLSSNVKKMHVFNMSCFIRQKLCSFDYIISDESTCIHFRGFTPLLCFWKIPQRSISSKVVPEAGTYETQVNSWGRLRNCASSWDHQITIKGQRLLSHGEKVAPTRPINKENCYTKLW